MNIHFTFPDGLILYMPLNIIPRHSETIDFSGMNDPSYLQTKENYTEFKALHALKTWKVNTVHYKLSPGDNSVAIIDLIEKEENVAYSVS